MNVCRRLSGAGGEVAAIFRLDTAYGGGKTHGLIALAHAAKGLAEVPNVSEFLDAGLLPKGPVRVAAFDGENADPANGRRMGDGVLAYTPWGEIAYALAGKNGYERVRKSDETGIAPGAETLRELFGGEPALILLDELSVYLRKVRRLEDANTQLTAFLTSLFKAVELTPQAALVYTLAIGKDGVATDALQPGERVYRETNGRGGKRVCAQGNSPQPDRRRRDRPSAPPPTLRARRRDGDRERRRGVPDAVGSAPGVALERGIALGDGRGLPGKLPPSPRSARDPDRQDRDPRKLSSACGACSGYSPGRSGTYGKRGRTTRLPFMCTTSTPGTSPSVRRS